MTDAFAALLSETLAATLGTPQYPSPGATCFRYHHQMAHTGHLATESPYAAEIARDFLDVFKLSLTRVRESVVGWGLREVAVTMAGDIPHVIITAWFRTAAASKL